MGRPTSREPHLSPSSSSTSDTSGLTPSSGSSSLDLSALERQDAEFQASLLSPPTPPGDTKPQEDVPGDRQATADELFDIGALSAVMCILIHFFGFILSLYAVFHASSLGISTAIQIPLVIYAWFVSTVLINAALTSWTIDSQADAEIRGPDRQKAVRGVVLVLPALTLLAFSLMGFYLLMVLMFHVLASFPKRPM
ncbi:hypothetical protein MMC10_006362 [Thelotrema lepadinum]|nr:hypothetical protein [Thelotrema lepadinum]